MTTSREGKGSPTAMTDGEDEVKGMSGYQNACGSSDEAMGRAERTEKLTELESLSINVSDVDSTLVGEEDLVSLSGRVDTDVILGVSRVGKEGLDDEGVEGSDGLLDLLMFSNEQKQKVSSSTNPTSSERRRTGGRGRT